MKFLRFMITIVQRGSLLQHPVDFEAQRKRIIEQIPSFEETSTKRKKNPIKSYFANTRIAYSLMSSLAYLKNARRMNNMFFISDRHKVIYIRILKSAGTSMLKQFLPLIDVKLKDVDVSDEQLDVLGFYYEKKKFEPVHQGHIKFALVRNPFHRIVSAYLDLFDPAAGTFTYSSYWFGILKQDMSFKDFIETIVKIPLALLGPHFSPQSYILKRAGVLNNVTIYRIEKDMEQLRKFLDQYGMALPHLNKHSTSYDYRSYYDHDTFIMVSELYKEDINLLKYEDDYNTLARYITTSL